MTPDDDRSEFAAFRAETKLEISNLKEALRHLWPMQEARSGEREQAGMLMRDVATLRGEVAAVRADIKSANEKADVRMDLLENRQQRMLAIMLGVSITLQMVGGVLVWALNAGIIKMGGGP